jgi:hypothetical protein
MKQASNRAAVPCVPVLARYNRVKIQEKDFHHSGARPKATFVQQEESKMALPGTDEHKRAQGSVSLPAYGHKEQSVR